MLTTDHNFDYADRLREILVDTISAILHSTSSREKLNEKFYRIIPSIIQFAKVNNMEEHKPSIRFMRDSTFLCLDIIQIYDNKVKNLFTDGFLLNTLQVISKHNQEGKQSDLLDFANAILHQNN